MKLNEVLLHGNRADQPDPNLVAEAAIYSVDDEDNIQEQAQGVAGARTWEPYCPAAGSTTAINALTGDVTATGPGTVAATIANDAVTYAKMQNVSAASRVIGRGSAGGSGNPEELTIGSGLTMTGTVLDAVSGGGGINQLTSDVTAGPGTGSQAATIANDAVTYAKMQNISAASRVLGRGSAGGSGDPQELTLGSGLALTGTVLDTTGGAGGITQLTSDVTAGPGSGSQAATIANNAVSYAKMQDISAASRILGRGSAGGAGDTQELTLGSGLAITGTILDTAGSSGITQLTGDVTAGPGSGSQAATIPNDTVTYAKIQNISAASRLLGRGSAGGSGDTEEISLGTGLSLAGTTLNATGSSGTAALSGSNLGAIASANLSTLGTIDWWAAAGNLTTPAGQTGPAMKITGTGDIRESFAWMNPSNNVFTNTSGVTMSCTAGDGTTGTLSNGSFVGQIGGVGTGFRFRVKMKTTQQRLTIYTIGFSLEYTVTAFMSDSGATPVVITVNTGAATGGGRIIEFLFTGASAAEFLQIVAIETINLGSNPNLGYTGISLGT